MKKKNKKNLSVFLGATTVLTSVLGVMPVSASSINWDEVYRNAYNAMQEVEAKKTQQAINDARKYINELSKNENLINMASTLSSRVDIMQEKLFQQFYGLMYVNGKKKERMSQGEINKAREYVNDFNTYEGNKRYTESWSSAIDEFQQKNINETVTAIEVVEKSKAIEELKPAKELLNELKTSTNEDTKNFAKVLDKRITVAEKEIVKEIENQKEKELENKVKDSIKEIENNIGKKIDELKKEQQEAIDGKIEETKESINKKIDEEKKAIDKKIDEVKKIIDQVQNSEMKKQLEDTIEKLSKIANEKFNDLDKDVQLQVVKVFSINNKEVIVNFNKKVQKESAEKIGNYELISKLESKGASIGKNSKVQLLEDERTVVISLDKIAQNQEKAKLIISGIKDTQNNILPKTEKEVIFNDSIDPMVKMVKCINNKEVQVEFSEPMKEMPYVEVDSYKQNIKNNFKEGARKVKLILEKELTEGMHQLTIEGGIDYAEHSIGKKVELFKYTNIKKEKESNSIMNYIEQLKKLLP